MDYTDGIYGAHCPHCGSKSYGESRILISDLGYPIANSYKECKCKDCEKGFNIKLREHRLVAIHTDPRARYYKDGMNMEAVVVPEVETSFIKNEELKSKFEQALIFSKDHEHFRKMLEHFIDLLDESMRSYSN